MRLVNSKYFDVINISDENPETLVLENPNHFMGVLQSLKYQCETDEGDYVLSDENFRILPLSKSLIVIKDFLDFELYSKQLKNKLLGLISTNYNDLDSQKDVIANLNELAVEIVNNLPYSISFKQTINCTDLIKFLDFSFDYSGFTVWEQFSEYVSTIFDLLDYKILVTVNLKDYVDNDEYIELIKFFKNKKIPTLMIERYTHEELDDISHIRIIDEDLCVL